MNRKKVLRHASHRGYVHWILHCCIKWKIGKILKFCIPVWYIEKQLRSACTESNEKLDLKSKIGSERSWVDRYLKCR